MLLVFTLANDALCLQTQAKNEITEKHFWHGMELPPEPREGHYKALNHCIQVLTEKCGKQMLEFIFYARTELFKECCQQLIQMGEECNKKLSNTLSTVKKFQRWKGHIYTKSIEAYTKCLH